MFTWFGMKIPPGIVPMRCPSELQFCEETASYHRLEMKKKEIKKKPPLLRRRKTRKFFRNAIERDTAA